MSVKYSRYISRVARHPFAILPEKFATIRDLFIERASGHTFTDEEIAERLAAEPGRDRQSVRSDGAIAVIPIHGVIAHRADSFEASSGGTSVEVLGKVIGRAVADDSIASVLLDFDTPGGSVDGVPELAKKLGEWTKFKPIVAHVNALAASAGYWLASQATEIVVTPSGMVGSVGVFMALIDESEALAQAGIKVNVISAGDWKTDGAPWSPLSDEGRAHLQGQVNDVYRDFLSAIAKGRGISLADVKANYDGRVYDAKEALRRGMVDKIATVEETVDRMMRGRIGTGRARGSVNDVKVHPHVLTPEQIAAMTTTATSGSTMTYVVSMSHPAATTASAQPQTMPPDEDGNCPDGYDKGDDGQCHMMDEDAKATAQQIAADRDALDLAVEETR